MTHDPSQEPMPEEDETTRADEADAGDVDDAEGGERRRRRARKERVLHTRIPAVLESELKAAAEALRVPVSNLVRTILEDAVTIADRATGHVEDRITSAARSVLDDRERARAKKKGPSGPLDHVVAFQPVIVAAAARCARCEAELEPGDDAALGVTDKAGPKVFVCADCLPKKAH